MIDARELSVILKCSPRTVYRLVDAGRIPPPCRLGSLSRWNPAVIMAWIAQGCQPCRKPFRRRDVPQNPEELP
jgi:predicted DNA-binding transcriptional regulator AlpA